MSDDLTIADLDRLESPLGIAAFDGIVFARFDKEKKTVSIDTYHMMIHGWKLLIRDSNFKEEQWQE